ncbi:MAG: RNA-binding S4 domain-containing protein [Saprospiraceae bacterium]|nr:RNA-binding S4 domain-containing protein [Candidatus Vicinibacter affinis]MBP6172642.1 RNA-binding S4 domain-containing protein [Saprospiraceae bacterium]MBK6571078.1 RNA-binding S4 domain-containing protein [Candidatus Vicinibacter affinis]MBK6822717.1 RNA-binding S4 domain-containing protein [Candidatus Vicinibacter affinis]MBK7799774.1 RNA-binding S4 domain-containing protein [Candidatus Vicinibacter affinis]
MRIDKWLWAVRFYKSRTLAALSCKSSKVKINGHEAKSSSSIKIGDIIEIKKNGFFLKYQALGLPEKRTSAPLASLAFSNLTPPEELNKYNEAYRESSYFVVREKGAGRPTKKERREIELHHLESNEWPDFED